MTHPSDSTWHEHGDLAIRVDDTEVGREILLYEWTEERWTRRYAMSADVARVYYGLLGEVFPDEE